MITKLRKAQDSWAAKTVFTLTALSFVSLFGVSGYLNSAAENPAVIKVNDNGLSLAEFNQQIDEQIRMARRLFGDNIEVTDEVRNSIASELVQKNLSEMIVKEVAKLKSGSAQPNRNKVAEITWEQVKAIAEDKMPDLNCFTLDSAMRMDAGTARSMGINVKGAFPELN